jgi:prophage maintenance system killer protein
MDKGNIQIFNTAEGGKIEVQLRDNTIWLDAHLISNLFDVQRPAIVKHINNIYKTEELDKNSTCSILEQVASDGRKRKMNLYNLDVIISVGYRVNSRKATQFRQWSNQILKNYLVKGYAVNEKRLQEKAQQLQELKEVILLQEKIVSEYSLEPNETEGLISVIASYSKALDMLDDYDHQRLQLPETGNKEVFQINYKQARKAIDELGRQTQFQGLFGREKDDSFKSSLSTIYQTFDGKDLYPTTEEKAANLLYFVVKNHSFTDGNKRIAAFLFVWFLDQNKLLIAKDGKKRISDNALVALTLMIAESHPDAKDMMIKLVVNLLANNE